MHYLHCSANKITEGSYESSSNGGFTPLMIFENSLKLHLPKGNSQVLRQFSSIAHSLNP